MRFPRGRNHENINGAYKSRARSSLLTLPDTNSELRSGRGGFETRPYTVPAKRTPEADHTAYICSNPLLAIAVKPCNPTA